jgi:HlyD family secretion protein
MEIWVSVNEADIGKIRAGQKAHFTVDTFPDQRLVGTVEQVRLNASMTQNVVSYTVIVSADNTDGKLLPYLTANVDFEIDCRPDVLSVPNAALRWRPTPEQVIPEARKPYEESLKAMGDGKSESPAHEGIVWVAEGHYVRPVTVKVGITNGTSTEVTGDNLEEGSQVVLGIVQATNAETAANPFMPKFSPRKKS